MIKKNKKNDFKKLSFWSPIICGLVSILYVSIFALDGWSYLISSFGTIFSLISLVMFKNITSFFPFCLCGIILIMSVMELQFF